MRRLIVLLAIELHHSRCRRQRQPVIAARSTHPSLHNRGHIERHKLPHRPRLRRLDHRAQRRQARIRHRRLTPPRANRLHRDNPRHIRAIAIDPQRCASDLRGCRPRRQHPQVELDQRRIAAANVQIAKASRVHRRLRTRHMRIPNQRRLLAPCAQPSEQQKIHQPRAPSWEPSPQIQIPQQRSQLNKARCRGLKQNAEDAGKGNGIPKRARRNPVNGILPLVVPPRRQNPTQIRNERVMNISQNGNVP